MTKSYENVDIRTMPKDKRPKPTQGQSAPERDLPYEKLNETEREVLGLLNGKGEGARVVRDISFLAEGVDDADAETKLLVRNSLRRLVACGWVESGEKRGTYRVSEKGRKRLDRAKAS